MKKKKLKMEMNSIFCAILLFISTNIQNVHLVSETFICVCAQFSCGLILAYFFLLPHWF